MIIVFLMSVAIDILAVLLSPLPTVTSLPLGMDEALVTASGYIHGIVVYFWPLQVVLTCLLWYMGVQVLLLFARFFFKDRIPYV